MLIAFVSLSQIAPWGMDSGQVTPRASVAVRLCRCRFGAEWGPVGPSLEEGAAVGRAADRGEPHADPKGPGFEAASATSAL